MSHTADLIGRMKDEFLISKTALQELSLRENFTSPDAGALVTFEGWVRNQNEGKRVVSLEYECFEPLARKEAEKVLYEARHEFHILETRCFHRIGRLNVGDMAVWVGVIAGHRHDAFQGCRYIIDELKARVPIWKKEYYADGESGWVGCPGCSPHLPGA